ncbi:MAG: type IV pilus twitching motility protein PilT [Chitinispirillales bacterium]|jgi:twitching motility protein PilT|nr:type IV pilus twitching motility protein PilT [Chitinispirillales bacterium]
MDYDELLGRLATSKGVSDIHFKVGRPPLVRVNGDLLPIDAPPLQTNDLESMAKHFMSDDLWERFRKNPEVDTSYSLKNVSRFRVNAFRQRGSVSLVLRTIPYRVPSFEDLGVPEVIRQICKSRRGLVIVTGITGSGKSSTLAAMVDNINEQYASHVITIEDPIEFLHRDKRGSINQREVGLDTEDFSSAFISALRQDPDVIVVGELRDIKTMTTALRAAETGHLVLSTLHTSDAKETINRFVDSFPAHQQKQIRIQLAHNLNAVISQRLISRADGSGRALACEIMVVNAAIREYIMDPEKLSEIVANMAKGKEKYGSQTFDQSIMELVTKGIISENEALANATSPNDLKLKLMQGL